MTRRRLRPGTPPPTLSRPCQKQAHGSAGELSSKNLMRLPCVWGPDMIGFIQKHRLHWTAWSFHPKATPRVIGDWDFTPTPFWGAFVRAALRGVAFQPPAKPY